MITRPSGTVALLVRSAAGHVIGKVSALQIDVLYDAMTAGLWSAAVFGMRGESHGTPCIASEAQRPPWEPLMRSFLAMLDAEGPRISGDRVWGLFFADPWFQALVARRARQAVEHYAIPPSCREDLEQTLLLLFLQKARKSPDLRVKRELVEEHFGGLIWSIVDDLGLQAVRRVRRGYRSEAALVEDVAGREECQLDRRLDVKKYVGASPSGRVTVFVDPTLGQPGLQNAQDLVSDGDRIAQANDGIFGTAGGPVSVIIYAIGGATDGTGGADHGGCDYSSGAAIEVCASFGNSARVGALFEAELSECSMGGNLCGESTGEALSRWCASVVGNNALTDFATAPTWAQDGMPDWVDQTEPTDQDPDSIGCGMAFISWLMSLGQTLPAIARAMVTLGDSGTLAELYQQLTGDTADNAWPKLSAAVQALPAGVTSDDPFGQPSQAA